MKSTQTKRDDLSRSTTLKTFIILLGVLVALLIGITFTATAAMPGDLSELPLGQSWIQFFPEVDFHLLKEMLATKF